MGCLSTEAEMRRRADRMQRGCSTSELGRCGGGARVRIRSRVQEGSGEFAVQENVSGLAGGQVSGRARGEGGVGVQHL